MTADIGDIGDPYEFLRERFRSEEPRHAWRPLDSGWAERARTAVVSAIGVVDEPWPAPGLVVTSQTELEDHTRSRVEFPSRAGWRGRGWLLVPKNVRCPAPAVVCLPGHGQGADAIVGLVDEPYQSNFALRAVREGWITLAVEQASFGANRSSRDTHKGSSCAMDSLFALVLGETMTGWRVRDAIAAFRGLAAHPLVNGNRVATLGISGGGLTALWAAAVEQGFCAAGVSGYFCPMDESILRFDHCPDNYVPGLAKIMDIPDLAGLIAPRWLAVENGTDDPIFAAAGFERAASRARQIYASLSAAERFASDLFEGDHVFHGEAILGHFRRALA